MSLYLQSLSTPPSTNPFHIYGPGAPEPHRVMPFPMGHDGQRRAHSLPTLYSSSFATSNSVEHATSTSVRLVPSQRWEQKKQRINTKTAWILTSLLFIATFVMMTVSTIMPAAQNSVDVGSPQHAPALNVLENILPKAKAPVIAPTSIAEPANPSKRRLLLAPIKRGILSSHFGRRWGRNHQGVDIAAPTGSTITAVAPGRVVYSGWEQGYGKSVLIDHGRYIRTRYAHCSSVLVKTGQHVTAGAMIARVGSTGHSTGPHLHFEIIVRGQHQNPSRYYRLGSSMTAIANLIE